MTWYAVRTLPGWQRPQRQVTTEPTTLDKGGKPRGKGYRLVNSLDPRISAVERALKERGFTYYMPAEKRLQRDRLRPYIWSSRRFALMVGYIFVLDPHNWIELKETPGVAGLVEGMDGRPLALDLREILVIRAAEAAAEVEFDRQSKEARTRLRKAAKKNPDLQKIVDKLDYAGTVSIPIDAEELKAA